uniref:Vomeronasal type-1 receptor n=1 Tax=Urocitellus parryii TaxID=9999 RepID=A0A8D2HG26_UROPR
GHPPWLMTQKVKDTGTKICDSFPCPNSLFTLKIVDLNDDMVVNLVKGIIVVFPTGLGPVGNIFVLVHYVCIFQGSEKKPIHLILIHLAFTNIITLFSRGMPRTVAAFALMNFLYDVGCKILGYLERVARGLSICTTSLLTVVQAITISPRASRWGRLKPRSAWHVLPLFLFFWMLNSLISMNLLFYIKNISNMNTSEIIRSDNDCYFQPHNWIIRWIFIVLMVLRDAVFQGGVMGGASGYMVFLLHKHHQQVLHLQTSKLLHRTPPEVKAAKSVLLLMLCFLFFYWTDCFMALYVTFSLKKNFIEVSVLKFVDLGYAVLSPFVLIHKDGHLAECWPTQ